MKKHLKRLLIVLGCVMAAILLALGIYKTHEMLKTNGIIKKHAEITQYTSELNTGAERSVQQIMIGSLCNSHEHALITLKNIKSSGYDGIELNDFMIQKTSFVVKMLTKAAGMPVGNGGSLDWKKLIDESGLNVTGLHSNLGSIESDPQAIADLAKYYGTDRVIITGMYRFDYSSETAVRELADRLNNAGKELAGRGIKLFYHNHNCELQKVNDNDTAYDIIIDNTDAEYVNFEFDSYWMADGGANVEKIMKKLGGRMKLWHINDRGNRGKEPYMTPILKQDATELGSGNMDLDALYEIAKENNVEVIVLETHKNWIDNDPIQSIINSGEYMRSNFD